MRPSDPKPLDRDLLEALELEKGPPWAPEDAKARVLQRVATTIGGIPGNGKGSGETGRSEPHANPSEKRVTQRGNIARPLSLAVAFGLGSVAGVVVGRATRPPFVHEAVEIPRDPTRAGAPAAAVAPSSEVAAAATPAALIALPSPTPASSNESLGNFLVAERLLLDAARAAFGRGDGEQSLAALARHEKLYPNGQLAEEREALTVRALVLTQRIGEARTRGARFRKRYPASVMLPAVEAALGSLPPAQHE